MKRKILAPIVVLFLITLSCSSFSQTPTADNVLSTAMQETVVPTAAELPSELTDAFGVPMVLIPEGEFTMGSDNGLDDEKPAHKVYLDSYYIDKYEVTNENYKLCVDNGNCSVPTDFSSETRDSYYGNSEFNNYPVIFVDWGSASQYCEWRGMHLPTEAEWEKAARGTDQRTYPWGEEINPLFANYDNSIGDTTPVGSYAKGISSFGVYDMAGNVSEWVSDWYAEDYYANSPLSNPLGPESGDYSVIRGGSWPYGAENVRSLTRGRNLRYQRFSSIGVSYNNLGFRCTIGASDISQQPRMVVSTQQTITQSPAYVLPDYLYLSDAYKITKNDDGSIEFYTGMSFDEIEEYYRRELPRQGYTERFVDEPSPAEGCVRLIFDGDPSGKALVITDCIIFSTEEHAVLIGLVDK